ncbi:MAG: hypothetical protein AB8E15_01755 [Bdellovibrionales bacterium]
MNRLIYFLSLALLVNVAKPETLLANTQLFKIENSKQMVLKGSFISKPVVIGSRWYGGDRDSDIRNVCWLLGPVYACTNFSKNAKSAVAKGIATFKVDGINVARTEFFGTLSFTGQNINKLTGNGDSLDIGLTFSLGGCGSNGSGLDINDPIEQFVKFYSSRNFSSLNSSYCNLKIENSIIKTSSGNQVKPGMTKKDRTYASMLMPLDFTTFLAPKVTATNGLMIHSEHSFFWVAQRYEADSVYVIDPLMTSHHFSSHLHLEPEIDSTEKNQLSSKAEKLLSLFDRYRETLLLLQARPKFKEIYLEKFFLKTGPKMIEAINEVNESVYQAGPVELVLVFKKLNEVYRQIRLLDIKITDDAFPVIEEYFESYIETQ